MAFVALRWLELGAFFPYEPEDREFELSQGAPLSQQSFGALLLVCYTLPAHQQGRTETCSAETLAFPSNFSGTISKRNAHNHSRPDRLPKGFDCVFIKSFKGVSMGAISFSKLGLRPSLRA